MYANDEITDSNLTDRALLIIFMSVLINYMG